MDELTGDVLVNNGRITAVGESLSATGARVIDGRGKILILGLVDTHWYMWNIIARSYVPMPSGEPFAQAMNKINAGYSPDLAYIGIRLSAAGALNGGVTMVNNWAHNIVGPAMSTRNGMHCAIAAWMGGSRTVIRSH